MMRIFSALVGLFLAMQSGLAGYCNNQPFNYHDPLGGQPIPNGMMGLTPGDVGRANMIGNMMTAGIPHEQAWEATTPRNLMMEKNVSDGLQLYMAMATVGVPVAAPARLLGVVVLDEALMGSGVASLTQLQANAFARRPLITGVPESAAGGFVLGGGASAIVRGAGAVPSLVRPANATSSVEFPMIPGMPLGYAGGPGAAWVGELGFTAKTTISVGEDLSSAAGTRVWRHVPEGHPALADAQAGVVKPFGITIDAPLDVRAFGHDGGATLGSGLTSWTADQAWAISRQQRMGGTILETIAPGGSIWFNQVSKGAEAQILIPGVIRP